jgi:UDP-N-acetyl-D-mannosaminuronate dehydrogenase
MPVYTVDLLERALKDRGAGIMGARVAVLGLAYKADIDDDRESPSYRILEELGARGASAVAFDPYVRTSPAASLDEALAGAHAAILATAHLPFRALTPRDFLDRGVRVVIDGKNCLPKSDFLAAGISYKGIGR